MDDSSAPDYEFGGFHLDTTLHVLLSDEGEPIALPSRAFEVLLHLVGQAGELVDKSALMAAVWPRAVVEENNLNQCIATLRKALGETAGERRFILTIPGRGFKFVAPVRVVPHSSRAPGPDRRTRSELEPPPIETGDAAVEAARPASPPGPSARRIARWRRRWVAVTAAALLTGALGLAAWLTSGKEKSPVSVASRAAGSPAGAAVDASAGAARMTRPDAIAAASIAVLPFDNQTGEKDKDYWGDGIAEELINSLSKVTGLQVRSKTSSFAYKGRSEDVRKIASELRVAKILEGAVQKGGDVVRVNVQLVDGASGQVTVSQNFEEKFANVFKLYDDVSNEVVRVMNVDVGARRPSVVLEPPTGDVEAYRLTLQGLAMLNEGGLDAADAALGFFQRAIARDPGFARAYAGMATAHLTAWYAHSTEAHVLAAERADQHALQLDPNSAEAESGLGTIAFLRRDMAGAEEHYREAEILDPNDAVLRFSHAQVQAYVGHMREAVQEMREAYALAPAIPSVVMFAGTVHSWAHLDAEALNYEQLAVALGVPKDNVVLGDIRGLAALRAGRYAVYLRDSFLLLPNEPESDVAPAQELNRLAVDAIVHPADHARRAAALAARTRLFPPGQKLTRDAANQCGYNGVRALAMLGDLDAAYALANQCLDEAPAGQIGGESCPWQPEWRKFREDPRFQAYVARRGALPYYERYGPPDDCDYKDGKLTCH